MASWGRRRNRSACARLVASQSYPAQASKRARRLPALFRVVLRTARTRQRCRGHPLSKGWLCFSSRYFALRRPFSLRCRALRQAGAASKAWFARSLRPSRSAPFAPPRPSEAARTNIATIRTFAAMRPACRTIVPPAAEGMFPTSGCRTYCYLLGGSMVRARLGRIAANVLMVAMLVLAASHGRGGAKGADLDGLKLRANQAFEAGLGGAEALDIAEKMAAAAQNIETKKQSQPFDSGCPRQRCLVRAVRKTTRKSAGSLRARFDACAG